MTRRTLVSFLVVAALGPLSGVPAVPAGPSPGGPGAPQPAGYDELVRLFREWREFQQPHVVNGVPDYTAAAMAEQRRGLPRLRARLGALAWRSWPVAQQVDYLLVRAEMDGLDFDHRVMRPWSRSPAFYAVVHPSPTDVPAREGSERYGTLCLYEYPLPLTPARQADLRAALAAIPPLLDQARGNLTEEAKDLWFTGIRVKKQESAALAAFATRLAGVHPELVSDVERARTAVDTFCAWLEERQRTMTRPSGIGIANYDWYLKHVHLVPYTWQDQRMILERELARAWSQLGLEEVRNAALPPLEPPAGADEYRRRYDAAVAEFMTFLDRRAIFTVPAYMRDVLAARAGRFSPPGQPRDFFTQIEYHDSLPMRCHGTHWFDLARMEHEPHASPIRRVPLLYNIWDSRAEGLATGFEEMMLSAGLFDARPRARELVYTLLANRAARAMGDLRMHSNEFTLQQAVDYAVAHTPRGWLLPDGGTAWFDAQLYLQQPGYGTSYVVGKAQIDRLLADRRRQLGDRFRMAAFMDAFHAAGMIPVSLIRWEMTGLDDEVRSLLDE